ncbi:pigment-dispersing hormone peptides isoform X3 [Pogonomyrmex barbatus]|uniref:Pigment-dispersing hormone peptides isoform X3 n=1 Tax=Pogonomyrmex barbatus TaxID=144034 RepID=A0A6I9W3R6_9HYME|nr:pigment-dispersing hormone peptides isoform X3 [Pogonomyrmex barbatus]
MLYSKRYIVHRIRCHFIACCRSVFATASSSIHPMANYTRYAFVIAIIVSIVCGEDSNEFENVDRNLLGLNLPYGRGLDNEMQLAKLLLMVPRFCHPKRNSELINSLLGLPKNMHNAGK